MIRIENAKREQAADIASLIMNAMTDECCLYFCGKDHTLEDFHKMMTRLVEREDSQYSFLNTIVALNDSNEVVGICTAYDGGQLHQLRKAFVEAAATELQRDFSNMDDETEPGELYVDSLAVKPAFRRMGIASALLKATQKRAKEMGIGKVGLLVDTGNPVGEALYASVGFKFVGNNTWGGHAMKHLQL